MYNPLKMVGNSRTTFSGASILTRKEEHGKQKLCLNLSKLRELNPHRSKNLLNASHVASESSTSVPLASKTMASTSCKSHHLFGECQPEEKDESLLVCISFLNSESENNFMKLGHRSQYRSKQTWEEIIYGKSKEPIASKALRHTGYICAGGSIGSMIAGNLYLTLILLGLAWSSAGVRYALFDRKKKVS